MQKYNIIFFYIFWILGLCFTTVNAAAPANDNIAASVVLNGPTGTTSSNNYSATAEVSEPNHGDGGLTAKSSVWFTWQAPSTGQVVFDTLGSRFDTVLAAYTGSVDVTNLTLVVNNDDATGESQSRIYFSAVKDTTYYIAVDGFNGEQGNLVLNWKPGPSPALNDNINAATPLSGGSGTQSVHNFSTTAETGERNHGDGTSTAYRSVWFTWQAPSSGKVVFDTFGSDFDTVIAAYTGSADVTNLSPVVNNDDTSGENQSRIYFSIVKDTIYYIAVDGFEGDQGNIVLNWTPGPTPSTNDQFSAAHELSGSKGKVTFNNFAATAETGEPNHGDGGSKAYASIWFKWMAPYSVRVVFDTIGSDFDTVMAAYTGSAVNSLTPITYNDDATSPDKLKQSRIYFTVEAGKTYYIAVDGFEGDKGNVVLNFDRADTFPWPLFLPAIISHASSPKT